LKAALFIYHVNIKGSRGNDPEPPVDCLVLPEIEEEESIEEIRQ
jgi:hypothetical protein